MKKIKKLFIIIFMTLLFLPLIFFNWKDEYISKIDNRSLKKFPNRENLTGENIAEYIQNYINDRIGGREKIINIYTILNDKLFNIMEHPTYTYGEDGYIFFKIGRNIEYQEYHRQFAEAIKKIQIYCEEREIPFYFVFNPEKTYVYSEYLPKGVNYNRYWVDRLMSDLDELGVNYIDNSNFLKEKAKKEFVFNKKYDAGHWNDLGAFLAMNNVYEKISHDNSKISVLKEAQYDKLIKIEETLPVSYFRINEETPNWKLKMEYEDISEQYIDEVKRQAPFLEFNYYKNLSKGAEKLLKLMIFRGSYLNSRGKFVIPIAKEYIGINNYQNVLNIPYYVNIFRPDIVIFEVAEYTIKDSYFSAEKMKNLDLPPFIDQKKKSKAISINNIDNWNSDLNFQIEYGNKVSKIILLDLPKEIKYVYLSFENKMYDFMRTEDGIYELSVLNDLLKNKKNFEIYYITDKEKIYKFLVTPKKDNNV